MSSKFVKYPSISGVDELRNGQILDFDFPNYGQYDPPKSYISLLCELRTVDGVSGVHSVYQGWKNNAPLKNSALIGDYQITSSKYGILESVLNSNRVNASLNTFESDWEQAEADNYKSFNQHIDPSAVQTLTPNTNFRKMVGNALTAQTEEIKIKLSDLSPMMKQIPLFDCGGLGMTRLQCKVDTSLLGSPNEYLPYNSMYQNRACDNIAGAASAALVITENLLQTTDDIELAVNDRITLTWTIAGPAVVYGTRTIIGITLATDTVTVDAVVPISNTISFAQILYDLSVPLLPASATIPNVVIPAGNNPIAFWKYIRNLYMGHSVYCQDEAGAVRSAVRTVLDVLYNYETNTLTFILSGVAAAAGGASHIYLIPDAPQAANAYAEPGGGVCVVTINGMQVANSKLWVGMKVRVTGTTAAPAKGVVIGKITNLANNAANLDITINAIAAPAGVLAANFKIKSLPYTTYEVVFSRPTIVFKMLMPNHPRLKNAPKNLEYSTYTVEACTIPIGTLNFNRQFTTDMSRNMLFLLYTDTYPESVKHGISKYRMQLDGKYVTNSDIMPFDALHNDGVLQCVNASPLFQKLRNLNNCVKVGSSTQQIFMPCVMLPDANLHQIQASIYFNVATTYDITVYAISEKIRVVDL